MSHKSSVKGEKKTTTTTAAVGYKGGESNNNRGRAPAIVYFGKADGCVMVKIII